MRKKSSFILMIYPEALTRNPGSARIHRMIRSLSSEKKIILLTKGPKKEIKKTTWGFLLTTEQSSSKEKHGKSKKTVKQIFQSIKSKIANTLLCPDAGVWWTQKVLAEESFSFYFSLCDIVLSSSPPNSVHLLALKLKKKYSLTWFMDMRDGWIDEPLKKTLFFLKPLEKRQEALCLRECDKIIANTDHWAAHLAKRFPSLKDKTKIIYNSIEAHLSSLCELESKSQEKFLLHSGSFRVSDERRELQYVLRPLLEALKKTSLKKIVFIGKLNDADKKELFSYQKNSYGITLEAPGEVPQETMAKYLKEASGFFLSSHSYSALPSKFLDYLSTDKAILCFCEKGSSLDEISRKISSCFSVNLQNPSTEIIQLFFKTIETPIPKRQEKELIFFRETTFKKELLSLL